MAENENTITVVGRIGQEPELRATSKGDVVNFTVATSERKRATDGTWSDGPTSWFRVAAWHDLGRNAHASLHRGQLVIVRGVLSVREFQLEGGGRSKQVELRATALGHDLRWGTSTYTDGVRSTATQAPVQSSEQAVGHEQVRETVPPTPPADWNSSFGVMEETPF